jgi:flotillin
MAQRADRFVRILIQVDISLFAFGMVADRQSDTAVCKDRRLIAGDSACELIRRQREAEAEAYEKIKQAEAMKAEAEARRYAAEQEAAGIRAKGLAEAEAIEKKAEAQKKMGEASVLEMYLSALPEVVKNAAMPLAQTDRIVMYGDGNSTKMVGDVMKTTSQIMEGVKEATGIDLTALITGVVAGKSAANTIVEEVKVDDVRADTQTAEETF